MSLSSDCSSCFDLLSRSRGREYYQSGRVRNLIVQGSAVRAQVQGSRGEPYAVFIEFDHLGRAEIVADCTCPRFADGDLCKHIWATLLSIDEKGLVERFAEANKSAASDHSARIDHSQGPFGEEEDDDFDEFDDDDLDGDEFDDDDDFEDDWEDEDPDEAIGDARVAGVPIPDYGRRSWNRTQRSSQGWQQHLASLASQLEPAHPASTPNSPSGRPCRVWYVVNVGASLNHSRLTIDLYQQAARKDGTWGKIKKLSLRSGLIESFAADDRALVQLLLGNDLQSDSMRHYSAYRPYAYGYSYSAFEAVSRVVLTPPLYEVLPPRLAGTGRFLWLLDAQLPPEDGQAIAWDDGPPWKARLRVSEGEDESRWLLGGELFRDEQVRPLEDAVLLLAQGLVLFPDSLARLDAAEHFAWITMLRRQRNLEIPRAESEAFLRQLWSLRDLPPVELPESLQIEQVQGTPQPKLCIQSPDRRRASPLLLANVNFIYGEHSVPMAEQQAAFVDPEQRRVLRRDLRAERDFLAQLPAAGVEPGHPYANPRAEFQFPARSLPSIVERLMGQGWVVESEGRLIRQAGWVRLNVVSEVDWFELDGLVDFGGIEVPLPRLLAALRNKHKYVRLDDGTQGILPDVWLKRFGSLVDLGDPDSDTLRFAPSQALLLDALLAAHDNVQVDDSFDQFRQRLRTFDGIEPGKEPPGFCGTLREYQRDGLGWLDFLREFGLGGCLADDMGLGKTIQVLALLLARRRRELAPEEKRRASLLVVPKSLVFNWIDEAARFTPELRLADYTGLGRGPLLEQLDCIDVLVTTYGTLRRDIVKLKDIRFEYAILDESQAIKNADSQAAKACRLLRADHRLAMTGTPVENHVGELWSLFEFLNPGMLGRSSTFQTLVKQGPESNGSIQMLSRALRPFLLRRTKEQVLTELPEKTEQTLHCELAPKQRKLYDELREYYQVSLAQRVKEKGLEQSKIHVLEALLRLRQAACHPALLDEKHAAEPSAKLQLLLEHVQQIVDEGHKALVFSQFTSLLAIVRKHLDEKQIAYEYLDGRTRKRKDKVDRFQQDPSCPLFLISLKAGGHGLNLTAADYVFILDPWWNPAVESQAIDRAHRLGQTRHVFAYRLICRNTVEDKIVELQQSKRELADAIISADTNLIRQLTADDLQLLLS